jgi:hypothetical protein
MCGIGNAGGPQPNANANAAYSAGFTNPSNGGGTGPMGRRGRSMPGMESGRPGVTYNPDGSGFTVHHGWLKNSLDAQQAPGRGRRHDPTMDARGNPTSATNILGLQAGAGAHILPSQRLTFDERSRMLGIPVPNVS